MKTIYKLSLPILALAILIFAHHALAQSKADKTNNISANTNAATVAPAPIASDKSSDKKTLVLTDAEKADLANLNARFIQADQILTARLRVVLEIECDGCEDYPVKLAIDDARKFYREQVKTAQAAYQKRLEEAQQRADCLGCDLGKDGVFVKPQKK